MALTIPARFTASLDGEVNVTNPPPAIIKIVPAWSPEQMGDGPDGKRLVQPQYRVRRWVAAWQTTCHAYGMPVWSVYVPCHVCGAAVHAYRADPDHLESRENGGQSNNGSMMLTHPGCNRIVKAASSSHNAVRLAARAVAPRVISLGGMPNRKGGASAQAFYNWFNAFPRREN